MQIKDTRGFNGYSMNLDKDVRDLLPNEYRYIENCTDLVYNNPTMSGITNIESNKLIVPKQPLPDGINTVIGSYEYLQKNAVIYFIHNGGNKHCIGIFYRDTETIQWIFYSEPKLNFKLNFPINSITVIDGMLNWTDNYTAVGFGKTTDDHNEIRSCLIEKAIKYTESEKTVITFIENYYWNNANYIKLNITGIAPQIGTDIYVKGISDEYYNGLATVIYRGNNYVVINKDYISAVIGVGYFMIYEGNVKYYEITDVMLRFIKKPPTLPAKVKYKTKISDNNNYNIFISDWSLTNQTQGVTFIFFNNNTQISTSVIFKTNPTSGQYLLTSDKTSILNYIAYHLLSTDYLPINGWNVYVQNDSLIIEYNGVLINIKLTIAVYAPNPTIPFSVIINGIVNNNTVPYSTQGSFIDAYHSEGFILKNDTKPYGKSNMLRGRYFSVQYRYKYDDKSYSVFSDGSEVVLPLGDINALGFYTENEYLNNLLAITVDCGYDEVEEIEIAITTDETPDTPYIIKRIYKYDYLSGKHIQLNTKELYKTNTAYTYDFDNTEFGINVSNTETDRLFDLIPFTAKEITILESRNAVISNYPEGQDNVTTNVKATVVQDGTINNYPTNIFTGTSVFTNNIFHIGFTNTQTIPDNTTFAINFSMNIYSNSGANLVTTTTVLLQHTTINNEQYSAVILNFNQQIVSFVNSYIATLISNGSVPSNSNFGFSGSADTGIVGWTYYSQSTPDNYNIQWKAETSTYLAGLYPTFKAGATHNFAIRYKDIDGRCGAENQAVSVYVKTEPEYYPSTAQQDINYIRNNIKLDIYNKPPVWADSYDITYSKSNVDSFIQYYANLTATSIANGICQFNLPTLISDVLSRYPKTREGITNYTYKKGDRLRILGFHLLNGAIAGSTWTYNGITYNKNGATLPSQIAPMYVMPEPFDVELYGWDDVTFKYVSIYGLSKMFTTITNIQSILFKIEIYTPKKELADASSGQQFYTIGSSYPIINGLHGGDINQTINTPATVTLKGGDVFVRTGLSPTPAPQSDTDYLTLIIEDENITDYSKATNIWYTKPSLVLQNAKQKLFESYYRWGGNFLQDADVSYLKRFLAADYDMLSEVHGGITKTIQRAHTFKMFQDHKTTSQYLNVTEMATASGNSSIIKSDKLFNSKKPSDFDYGTMYPKSVVRSAHAIYSVDVTKGVIIVDNENEPQDITFGRVKSFMNYIKKQFNDAIYTNVHSVYLQKNEIVLFTFIWQNANERKDRYSSKTLVWSEPEKQFKGCIDNCINKDLSIAHKLYTNNRVTPIENLCPIGDEFMSFIGGDVYLHGSTTSRGELYGEQKPMLIQTPTNAGKGKIMVLDALEMRTDNNKYNISNPIYNWEVSEVTTPPSAVSPTGQLSKINAALFKQVEGLYVSSFLRDIYTKMIGSDLAKLHTGNVLRGESALITLQNYNPNPVELYAVTVKESVSELS